MKTLILFQILFIFAVSCGSPEPTAVQEISGTTTAQFSHEIQGKATPWSSEKFNNKAQFSFAIISDLNGGEREGVFSKAVERINLLHPKFVLSVGDLIDGGTEDIQQLKAEFDSFDERAVRLNAPFFHIGGNHDLTNPVMRQYWIDRYGATYYHFIYQNVLFLMMDSEDYDEERMQEIYLARAEAIEIIDGRKEGKYEDTDYYKMRERTYGHIRDEQAEYFAKVIQDNPQVDWTFILMHKPVWENETGGLEKLEAVLTPEKYTVINGHFHSYSHRIKNESDHIILGTTGGSQRANDPNAFDHFTYVTMTEDGPSIINFKLEGILDKRGN